MKYPTPGEYQEAVQSPAAVFSDPILKDAEPEMTKLGLPEAMTGAFAVVFPMRAHGVRWAVKCFLTDVPDQRERYHAVARCLAGAELPHTAAFDYQPQGIHVHGDALPVLKMEWLDGISIARFIESHLSRPDEPSSEVSGHGSDVLKALHNSWREMIRRLEKAGIAHGDLQHGNILVDGKTRVRLVDYDTMYVPSLQGKKSPEVGHRNYQHPDRDESDFGPYLDRFSALVIDTAIQACIYKPELWARYSTGENLLFGASDFFDPDASALFDELLLAPGALRAQADMLRRACHAEPEDAPSLEQIASGDVALRTTWAAHRRSRRALEAENASRTAFERRFAPTAAAIFVVVALLLAIGLYAAAVAVVAAAAAVGGAGTFWQYRRLSPVRRRHRLQKEEAYFSRLIRSLEGELERLEEARAVFVAQMESEYDRRLEEIRETVLRDHLKHHFVGEARGFDGITHKAVVRLKLAGIRTAYQATPKRVGDVLQLSDESKARIGLWRAALASECEAEIPRELSPAEERRVKRSIEVRLEDIDAEIARIRNKIDVQQDERDQLRTRMAETRHARFARYLLYLLRLRKSAYVEASAI